MSLSHQHQALKQHRTLEEELAARLDNDSLLRVKAVEAAIAFLAGKSPTAGQFHETYNTIYKFYGNNTKELHQRSLAEEEPSV